MDQQSRGKHSVAVNMKSSGGQQVIQDLSAKSDVILDPFRPGVMERLGCGPGSALAAPTAGGLRELLKRRMDVVRPPET